MWTEISITVDDGELAEAVSEVLGRYIPEGIFIQATGVAFDPDSEGRGIAPYRVGGYLPENNPGALREQIETALGHLSLIHPIPEPQYREIESVDWTESWKANFHPVAVGEKLVILPPWEEPPSEQENNPDEVPGGGPLRSPGSAHRTAIWIEPGLAFGTGTHPSTRLAMELLEKALHARPGANVLDIGSGSGILSIAAHRLGAGTVVGVDVDPEAMANAHRNAELNGADETLVFGVGSVAEVRSGAYPIRRAPIVIANILAHILIRLLDDGLGSLVAADGRLILSGILDEREAEVVRAAARGGFEVIDRAQEGDWVALAAERGQDARSA